MKNKLEIDTLLHKLVVIVFKDDTTTWGWFVQSLENKKQYEILPNIGSERPIIFSPSTIKYIAYINGSCIFKGYGRYIQPIFESASLEKRQERVSKLLKWNSDILPDKDVKGDK